MNMSDDISGAVVGMSAQVAQKGVETAQQLVDKTVDNIAKLLQAIFKKGEAQKNVKSSDMKGIKPGEVNIKKLVANGRKNGDSVVATDGYSKADMRFINKKAKEYGIPVAFTSKKNADNICAHVRGNDKAVFERICTEMITDKLKARPQELDNFKAERWEIGGIQRELSKHDLNANWGKTKGGEYFCLFEKSDKKAVLIARDAFVQKCNEVEKDLTVEKSEDGFYTLKDEKCGKEISFTDIPARSELSEMLQNQFGYDENKAEIACGKFGENNLDGVQKAEFFSDSPQQEFSDIQNHVTLKDENILAGKYDCLRVIPKTDEVPRIVFRDENNNFVVLKPEKMTRKEMSGIIRDTFELHGAENGKTVAALVDKAERVTDFYVKQNNENFSLDRKEVIGDVKDDRFIEYQSNIERLDKNRFSVDTAAVIREYRGLNVDDAPKNSGTPQTLILSFSDKKNALSELQKMYEEQGVPAEAAKQSAKEVFSKAKAQSAEKVLQIEEIKSDKQSAEVHGASANESRESVMTVKYGNRTEEIDITDREKTLTDLTEKFGVTEDEAVALFDKAQEKIGGESDAAENENEKVITNDKNPQTNGHEKNIAEPVNLDAKPVVGAGGGIPETPKAPKRR